MSSSGQPTTLDYINGLNYAYQQVNKMKCVDPDIIKEVCNSSNSPSNPGGGTCITWREDKREMTFPVPSNYYVSQCSKDSDCEMGVCRDGYCSCRANNDCKQGLECIQNPNSLDKLICGYAPKDTTAGHCVFTNKTACTAQGQLPYNCTPDGCVAKEKLDYPYTEWRINSDTGQGKCVMGNFLLRQWCENPISRCAKDPDTGKYPDDCTGGGKSPGVTDVPPFYYDREQGMCYMSHDYCDHYARDYNKPKCNTDTDCPGKNNKCVPDSSGLSQHCVGPDSDCEVSTEEKIAEFTVGRTLFYMFKKGTTCDSADKLKKEFYEPIQPPGKIELKELNKIISDQLKTTPEYACYLFNPQELRDKKLMVKNFAGNGINLYLMGWKNGNTEMCFDADEVEKVYPQMVEDKPLTGGKMICISRDEIKDDKNLKRLFLFINSRGWATDLIGKICQLNKKVETNK